MFLLNFRFSVQNPSVSWLSISLDAAFGSKTNVFFINKNQCPGSKKINYSISINPQASSFVCRNVLEILIALAKSFPEQFISYSHSLSKNLSSSSLNTSVNSSKDAHDSHYSLKNSPNFFDVLLRHDSIYMNKKTKSSKHGMLGSIFIVSDTNLCSFSSKLIEHYFYRFRVAQECGFTIFTAFEPIVAPVHQEESHVD